MAVSAKQQLRELVDRLILEARDVLKTKYKPQSQPLVLELGEPEPRVDPQKFAKLRAGCLNLVRILGDPGKTWRQVFEAKNGTLNECRFMAGTPEAIKEAIDHELLVRVEDLVYAEAFSDLLEQADHLLDGGYFLAAGALGRAVLEEHLRKWCDRANCLPTKARSTMADLKAELYKNSHVTKVEQAHVEAMTATGNAVAHNRPELKKDDVERLLRDVRDFLVRHPLS